MRNFINIERTTFPCSCDVLIGAETFNFLFKYNKSSELFTCTLTRGEDVLVYDEPIIYGKAMFCDVYVAGLFPAANIVPFDESGESDAVTYDNFLRNVRLTIDHGGSNEPVY